MSSAVARRVAREPERAATQTRTAVLSIRRAEGDDEPVLVVDGQDVAPTAQVTLPAAAVAKLAYDAMLMGHEAGKRSRTTRKTIERLLCFVLDDDGWMRPELAVRAERFCRADRTGYF